MSEFWTRKIRTYFNKVDINNDGYISKKDVEGSADTLADQENLNPEQRTKIKNHFVALWRKYMKSAGSDENGLLTEPIMIASIDQQRNDPEFRETFVKFSQDYFGVLDVNGDGYLSEDEFARAYIGVGIQDTSFIHNNFEYLDVNKDGKLSINEYTAGFLAYLTTEDEHLLYGPLV